MLYQAHYIMSINFKIKAITIPYFIAKKFHNTLIFSNKNFSKNTFKNQIFCYIFAARLKTPDYGNRKSY